MSHNDPDPEAIGRRIFQMTLIAVLVFSAAAYFIAS